MKKKMELITKKDLIKTVAMNWKLQYRNEQKDIYKKLKALPKDATEEMIAEIIGNDSWTRLDECDVCGEEVNAVVFIKNGYSSFFHICESCLRKASNLFNEKEKK